MTAERRFTDSGLSGLRFHRNLPAGVFGERGEERGQLFDIHAVELGQVAGKHLPYDIRTDVATGIGARGSGEECFRESAEVDGVEELTVPLDEVFGAGAEGSIRRHQTACLPKIRKFPEGERRQQEVREASPAGLDAAQTERGRRRTLTRRSAPPDGCPRTP